MAGWSVPALLQGTRAGSAPKGEGDVDVPRDRDSNHVSGDGGAAALRVRVMSDHKLVFVAQCLDATRRQVDEQQLAIIDLQRRVAAFEKAGPQAPDGATAQDLMQEQDWQEEANRVRDGRESRNASPHDYDVSVMARVDRDDSETE